MRRLASSPSVVNSSSPSVFRSSRPTAIQRAVFSGGSLSNTVGSAFRVGAGREFTRGFVVKDGAWNPLAAGDGQRNRPAVDLDGVLRADAEPQLRRTAVDADTAGAYPVLYLATRSVTGAREDLLQTFCHKPDDGKARSLSDLGLIYCAGGRAAHRPLASSPPIPRCVA